VPEQNHNSSNIPVGQPVTTQRPGLLRRLFGGSTLSSGNAKNWPELEKAWAGREIEMPSEAVATNKVRPMNFIERSIYGPTVNAATYPWGSIVLNRPAIEKNQVDLPSLLVHELTHIGQGMKEGIWGAYNKGGSKDMPDYEQQAYDAENNRYKRVRTQDIALPTPKIK